MARVVLAPALARWLPEAGDIVRLIWEDATHGAWWCENPQQERGWVRAEYLQFETPAG